MTYFKKFQSKPLTHGPLSFWIEMYKIPFAGKDAALDDRSIGREGTEFSNLNRQLIIPDFGAEFQKQGFQPFLI